MHLAFFREKVELRKEALKQYAEQYGPLTIDTANDRMSRSFEWVMQPWAVGSQPERRVLTDVEL